MLLIDLANSRWKMYIRREILDLDSSLVMCIIIFE